MHHPIAKASVVLIINPAQLYRARFIPEPFPYESFQVRQLFQLHQRWNYLRVVGHYISELFPKSYTNLVLS